MKIIKTAALALLLVACQSQHDERQGDYYFSPAGAYILDLGVSTFRGEVVLDERCDRNGGATTFWDGSGRLFRVDYLKVNNHPSRVDSDLALLNLSLNRYLSEAIAKAPMIAGAEASYQEFLDEANLKALFAIIDINADAAKVKDDEEESGTYYNGFLLFKHGELIYVLQHRHPVLMPEKMKAILLNLAAGMEIPGEVRDDTDMEKLHLSLKKMGPSGTNGNPVRLCEPAQS
ncbi:hypothetical protein [Alcanivorax sp.]|jgi:hypothetical protein|uniref:hypothetical protein n=1 Tax=Alcanivorax sp. TaxID=1872427 RepID=UPI0032D92E08